MNPELAVLYAKLDIYEQVLWRIAKSSIGGLRVDLIGIARNALHEATKLSQPASQPEKPRGLTICE